MNHAGLISARRGRIALLSVLACAAFLGSGASAAEAANPSILNTNTGCAGQTGWLISCATAGQTGTGGQANQLRTSGWVNHDLTTTLSSILTDDDWDGTVDAGTVRGVSPQRPTIDGGYPRSRWNLTYQLPTSNTGMSCDGFPTFGGTRRTTNRNARIAARDALAQTSGTSSSQIKFVAAGSCTGPEDYAYIYSWGGGNFGNSVTPNTSLTLTYTGDDSDTTGSADFEGISYRYRNIRTGETENEGGTANATTLSCPSNGDNASKSLSTTAPSRGAWVLEAELRDSNDCGDNQNGGFWFPIGTMDVNSSGAPSLTLDSTTADVGGIIRPNAGSDWTLQAKGLVDPDSADGGGAQILEWDLNNNTGDGVDGYEETNYAGYGDILDVGDTSGTDATERNVDSSGQAPGLYTVRARVTDNGAGDAADSIRRRSGAVTLQYRVDALPVVSNQTITTNTNATNVAVNLGATDSDGDALTYSITDAPDHGTLSNGTTDDPTYTPTSGYAGTDSFTVQVNDGFGGTDTATITLNVQPNTSITANPTNPSTTTDPSFSFNSNGSPVTFQCQIDGGGFSACTSPKSYTGLGQGSHTFQVRAVATTGSIVDPSPASYTWVIDSVAPDTNLTGTPPALSNSTGASFDFDSPDGTATFECRLDSSLPAAWATCTSPKNYAALSQGSHTFEVRAKDLAGNIDATPASFTWNVDTVAPTTTLNTFPDDPTNVTSASFSFTADESASFECELDTGGFSPCGSPQTYAGPLSDGNHVFKVRATDPTGNTGNTVTFDWDIDTNEPETTIDVAPPSLTNQSMADFEFSSDESPGVTFQCRIDSSLPGAWESCTSPKHYSSLTHGSHTLEVRATDAAGNTDQTPDTHTWNIDLVNPNTAIDDDTAPGNGHPSHRTTDNNASFDVFSSDLTATFECRVDGVPGDFVACTSPKLYSGLTDGVHTFHVRAKDPAGNYDPTPATWTWEIYNGLPDTIFDATPPAASNSASATFGFHSTIPDSTFECSLDGASLSSCNSPVNLTGLSEDTHTFEVVATDEFARTDPAPATYEWTVDLTDPDTTITANPDDPSGDDFALFQFQSDETGTFECKLDAGDWGACGETQPQEYTNLDDGSHTFTVRAIDEAGNVDETPAAYTWVVDTTAPDTAIDSMPDDPSKINNPSFEFSSSESPATFECRLDSSSPSDWETCETDLQYSDLIEGSHTFEVRSTDEAGNTDPDPASYTWYVDLTAPETSITDGPDDPTNETLADFVFNGSDNHSAAGDLNFQCRINSTEETAWEACTSPKQITGLTAGANKVEIRATDEAGNTDASPAVYEWIIDQTAPTVVITDGPLDPTISTSASVEFTSEVGATFECRLDSTDVNDWASCSSPFTDTVGEGPHVFEVRATDTADNTGPVEMHTWVVDTTAPDTTITSNPSDPSNDTSPTFAFDGDDTPGSGVAGFECQLDGSGWEPCTSAHEYTSLTGDGSHTFEVRAIDNAGNVDASPDSYVWTLDTGAPDTTITGNPTDPTNSTSATFDFTGDDGAGSGVASFECEIDGGGFTPCGTGQNYPGLTPNQEHTFKVRAIDNAGNADPDPASYTWEIDTAEPDTSFTATPQDPSNTAGPQFAFESTEDGSSFECRLDSTNPGDWNSCSTPLNLTGLTDGAHTFEVRATDPSGNIDSTPDSYTWVVDTTEPDTSITANPPDPSNDTSPSFEFNGSDPGGSGVASFECELDGNGFEPCSSAKDYTGVTTEGPHTFKVRAIDNAGNIDSDSASYTWTLDTTAPGVSIDSGPNDPTNLDSGSLAFTVTGADVASTVCELDGAPETVNCPSGTVPFTGMSDGPHEFTVTATDTSGNSNSDTWNWTVDTAEPETTIDTTPTDPTTLTNIGFGFSSDETPATFECQLDGGAFESCAAPYSHAPLLRGPHTFSVRATDEAGNTDATPATHAFNVAEGAVLGGKPPLIKRRIRALNVPAAGSFQVATVTCRDGSCTIDQKSAVIKVAGKTYRGTTSVELEPKTRVDHLTKGDVALVVVHFAPNVQRALVANHFGQLVVKISASTDAGGAATFKKIKLKAKWLKELF